MNERLGQIHFWLTYPPAVYAVFIADALPGAVAACCAATYDHSVLRLQPRRPAELAVLDHRSWPSSYWRRPAASSYCQLLLQRVQAASRPPTNPWQATSFEWTTDSPPPGHGNWKRRDPRGGPRDPYEYGPRPPEAGGSYDDFKDRRERRHEHRREHRRLNGASRRPPALAIGGDPARSRWQCSSR